MSDHLDRAAAIVGGCCAHCDDLVDERLALLDEAGLLVSPERDKERSVGSPAVAEPPVSREDVEAVLKLAYKGTSDMDREPNWLGRVRRWARDGAPFPTVESTPEPATPEHDAAVAAKALREAADTFARFANSASTSERSRHGWESARGVLLRMAEEREAGESGA